MVATAGDASAAVGALNNRHAGDSPHPLDTFAHVLLRVEAMASSRIEAINPSARRILTAEAEQREGGRSSDRAATEVLGNLEAMETAIRVATSGGPLRTADLLEVHTRLMATSAHPHLGGWVRDTQNWIGSNAYTPVGASYVPPPAEQVPALLADLVAYMNRSDIPPLIQAGITHAQFETIHPFADGNGRVGRALIHAVLHQQELAPAFVPPISNALARSPNVYFDGLTAYRHEGAPTDPGRDQAAEQWLGVFLEATYDACLSELDRSGPILVVAGWALCRGCARGWGFPAVWRAADGAVLLCPCGACAVVAEASALAGVCARDLLFGCGQLAPGGGVAPSPPPFV